MKKIIFTLLCIAFVFALLLSFASCGESGNNDNGSQSSTQSSVPSEDDGSISQSSGNASSESDETPNITEPNDSLAGMTEAEKAFYLYNMDVKADIVKTKVVYSLYTTVNGKVLEAESSSTVIVKGEGEALEEYREGKTSITMEGTSTVQKITDGYANGRGFEKIISDGILKSAIYEEISLEEYLANREGSSLGDIELNEDNCKLATLEKDKSGNYIAKFTDIMGEGLREFQNLVLVAFESLVSNELADVCITLVVDPDLVPVSMTIEFEFDGENAPALEIEGEFTFDGDVEFPQIDWSEYSEKITPDNFETLSREEQAFHLLRAENEETTFTVDTAMSFSAYVNGRKLTLDITQKSIVSMENGGYSEYNVTKIESLYMGYRESSVVTQGYLDGKSFTHITVNGQFYAAEAIPMTLTEYMMQRMENAQDTPEHYGITEGNCNMATCSKDGEGYLARFLSLKGAPLEYFQDMAVEYLSYLDSYTLYDVILLIKADDQLKTTGITVIYDYGADTFSPQVNIETTYTYKEADFPQMDWSEFEISDDSQKPPSAEL